MSVVYSSAVQNAKFTHDINIYCVLSAGVIFLLTSPMASRALRSSSNDVSRLNRSRFVELPLPARRSSVAMTSRELVPADDGLVSGRLSDDDFVSSAFATSSVMCIKRPPSSMFAESK